MSERLLVIVTNSDPRSACEIVEPIYNATVAASMDYHVEMIFSGRSGEILLQDVAVEVPSIKDDGKSVYDLLQAAHEAGVQIKATKHLTTRWGDALIPEVDEIIGAGYIISEVMGNNSETLSY